MSKVQHIGNAVLIPLGVGVTSGVVANQFPQSRKKSKTAVEPLRHEKGRIRKLAYEDVVKSDDPNFNHKAAQKVFDLIMKMDDDEAAEFCRIVATEMVEETIEKNLGVLQRHLDQVLIKREERIRKAMLSVAAKDPERAAPYAAAFSEIRKARLNPYDYGYHFQESDFRRDPGTGRFQTKVTTSQKRPIHDRTAQALGLPTSADKITPRGRPNLDDDDLARYQDQYRQLAGFLGTVRQSSANPGDEEVIAHLRNRNTGETYTTKTAGTRPNKNLWDPKEEDLIGLTARPHTLTAGGAYFGLSSALGGSPSLEGAGMVNAFDANSRSFATDWSDQAVSTSDNERLYRRVRAGSTLAQQVAPPGSKVQVAGRMAEFVGQHGSEAEAVFGPTARKTAYRYRGVTRKPDSQLVQDYNTAISGAQSRSEMDPDRRRKVRAAQTRALNAAREAKADAHNKKNPKRPIDANAIRLGEDEANQIRNDAAAKYAAKEVKLSPEDKEAGRLQIVEYLNRKENRPQASLYNLQLASGTTPPSEGVLIDKNGKIVAQAVGYGDDHYLPFNLKNLKQLRGGEYVRRRSVGGLTTEDIYTGLMAGAAQVTVVSRSGVFTMSFEEDFKGGRRYNDKALRMTKRYAQLLDAVQSEQVDNARISEEMRHAIRDEVREEMGGYVSRQVMAKEIASREQEYKSSPELSEADEDRFRRIATLRAQSGGDKDVEALLDEVRNEMAAEKEFKFRLNGVGYAAALDALQEQFPYYIKVDSKPLRGHEGRAELEMDRGYVEPGRNRPTYAAAGLFGAKHASPFVGRGDKYSAAEANFQGGLPRRGNGETPPPGPGLTPTGEKKSEVKANIAQQQKVVAYAAGAAAVQNRLREAIAQGAIDEKELSEAERALVAMDNEGLRKPENQVKFDALVSRVEGVKGGAALLGESLVQYKKASGFVNRKPYTDEEAGLWPSKPFAFEGGAHDPSASYGDKVAALRAIDGRTGSGVLQNKKLSEMSEDELQKEHSVLAQLAPYMVEGLDYEGQVDLLKGLQVNKDAMGTKRIINDPAMASAMLKAVHEVRALKADMGTAKPAATKAEPDDIVITNAPTTNAEAKGPKAGVEMMAKEMEKIAGILADRGEAGDEEKANRLTLHATSLRNALPQVRKPEDAKDVFDMDPEAMRLFYNERRQLEGT